MEYLPCRQFPAFTTGIYLLDNTCPNPVCYSMDNVCNKNVTKQLRGYLLQNDNVHDNSAFFFHYNNDHFKDNKSCSKGHYDK